MSKRATISCGAIAATAMLALSAGAAPPGIEILGVVPLHHPVSVPGPRPRELSGLDWDRQRGELVAASDKGNVYRVALDIEYRRLHSATVRSVVRIASSDRPNAEAVAVDGETLWLADEQRHDLLQTDAKGHVLRREPLPAGLPVRGNSGIEALALHPSHGRLMIPQRPLRGVQEGLHRIYAMDGSVFAFFADRRGESSLKAADYLGEDRLLLVEKVMEGGRPRFQLRLVLLGSCPAARPCTPEAWPIRLPGDGSFNVEGLACLSTDLCMLVNDNANEPGIPSQLMLLALPPR